MCVWYNAVFVLTLFSNGTEATRRSTLISRMTDSGFGPYERLDGRDPFGISGVELVSVSAACEATLSWNVSIRTGMHMAIVGAQMIT